MVTLTNKLRLPEPIVRAVANDSYTKGDADISVTELLLPPQLRRLRLEHSDKIEEDAADRIWSLIGQAVHNVIERASEGLPDILSEEVLYSEYLGWKIKAGYDSVTISNSELNDFKVTTAWKIVDEKIPPEWVAQTNIYRRILEKEKGLVINSIAVLAILRDWSKLEAARNPNYPQVQVVRLEIPLWTSEQTDDFIRDRLRLHQAHIPEPCSEADIWAKPPKWAVIKAGNQRATKVFDNPGEAQGFAASIKGARVEDRPGVATRCASYCAVAPFCSQWQADPRRPTSDTSLFGS
jgi:hypothetical protein